MCFPSKKSVEFVSNDDVTLCIQPYDIVEILLFNFVSQIIWQVTAGDIF